MIRIYSSQADLERIILSRFDSKRPRSVTSRDRQFMDFFHGRQSPICPNHKLCGIPQLRIVSKVHARRLYAGHLSTLCAKTHGHGAINGSGQGDCYPL